MMLNMANSISTIPLLQALYNVVSKALKDFLLFSSKYPKNSNLHQSGYYRAVYTRYKHHRHNIHYQIEELYH